MDGLAWLSTAISAIVRWAFLSNLAHDGVENSTALRKPKKPKQHAS